MASWLMRIVLSSGKSRQASGNLLRAPSPGPSPILSWAMPATLPRNGGTRNGGPTRAHDDAGQSLLHIGAQGCIERKLGRFGSTGRSLGVPLGCRCTIFQATAARRGVASELAGDGRRGSAKSASDLVSRKALNAKKCNLLAFRKREIPPGRRLGRRSKHRWCHAARLSE
jgi:hypothetical protein